VVEGADYEVLICCVPCHAFWIEVGGSEIDDVGFSGDQR